MQKEVESRVIKVIKAQSSEIEDQTGEFMIAWGAYRAYLTEVKRIRRSDRG
jgi:hypothetical protein